MNQHGLVAQCRLYKVYLLTDLLGALSIKARLLLRSFLIACPHDCFDTATDVEVTDDFCFPRLARLNKILQHLIDDVLMEDADISVKEEVLFQRFQFDTVLIGDIGDAECSEIR